MPNRKSLAAALAVLALGAGDASAQHGEWIEVLSYSWGSSQASASPVDGNRSITVHGHRTEDVGAAPDRDAQLKGHKILQNAPAASNPSPAGVLKLDGVDPKAAIAINTPLRTLPSRSAAVGPVSKFQVLPLPHQAPGLGASVGRR
jgi:hypothetical protein